MKQMLTNGAPETIKVLLSEKSLPQDFDAVSFHHLNHEYLVLAMAYGDAGTIGGSLMLGDTFNAPSIALAHIILITWRSSDQTGTRSDTIHSTYCQ
jgi:hypothetical protein